MRSPVGRHVGAPGARATGLGAGRGAAHEMGVRCLRRLREEGVSVHGAPVCVCVVCRCSVCACGMWGWHVCECACECARVTRVCAVCLHVLWILRSRLRQWGFPRAGSLEFGPETNTLRTKAGGDIGNLKKIPFNARGLAKKKTPLTSRIRPEVRMWPACASGPEQ